MAGPQLPKLATRVRFPSSAPKNSCKIIWFCNYFSFFERFCSSAEFENVTLWEADSVTFMYKGKGLPVTSSSPSKYFFAPVWLRSPTIWKNLLCGHGIDLRAWRREAVLFSAYDRLQSEKPWAAPPYRWPSEMRHIRMREATLSRNLPCATPQ